MTPTRAFVVAPAPVTRAGLRSMLANAEGTDVRVVGEASSPTDSSELSEADVVLLANEELLEEASFAVAEDGTQALVLISEEDHAVSRLRAMQLRGWGVVPPDAPPEELAAAVAAAGQGLIVLPKAVTERLLHEPAASAEELSETLTAREREVLDLLGHGLSNKLIGRELHISEHTVKFHISSLYAKLGVNNRAEAVSRGARYGLISL
ncbi:MAG TPA: response regulator transcription factor [Rubrobacteraceae bacterium]|nr:response regulator transcription factor [Rubrobacteraceae bacterium]